MISGWNKTNFVGHPSQLNGPVLPRLDFEMIPNFREKILAWKSSPPRTPKKVVIEERVNLFHTTIFSSAFVVQRQCLPNVYHHLSTFDEVW